MGGTCIWFGGKCPGEIQNDYKCFVPFFQKCCVKYGDESVDIGEQPTDEDGNLVKYKGPGFVEEIRDDSPVGSRNPVKEPEKVERKISKEGEYGSSPVCIEVIKNGDPRDKIDVVFLPNPDYNLPEDLPEFSSNVLKNIHEGILSVEPFKSNAKKFNFYIIDSYFVGSPSCLVVPPKCPHDFAIALGRGGRAGVAFPFAGIASSGGDPSITRHEFGHLLGLWDEYELVLIDMECNPIDPYGEIVRRSGRSSNCDTTAGCPNWCSGPPLEPYETRCSKIKDESTCNSLDCFWMDYPHPFFGTHCFDTYDNINIGTDCLEGTGCYFGCGGTNAWRPNVSPYACIMGKGRPPYVMDPKFCPVCTRHLEEYLSHYT